MKISKNILILVIIGLVLYFRTFFNGFVWDDEEMILLNPTIHSITNLPAFFSGSTFNSGGAPSLSGLYYKPLMTTAFSLIYTFFGPNAFIFHFVQVLIHIANAILVYLIIKRVKPEIAFIPALFFLIHPINVEAVVYLADYQEVMFFFFGAFSFYYLLKPRPKLLITSVLLLCSFLSKETGFVFSVITGIGVYLFNKQNFRNFLIAFSCTFLIYGVLRFGLAGIYFNKHGLTPMSLVTLPVRLVNIPSIIYFYLKTFIMPVTLAVNQQWIVKEINIQKLLIDTVFFIGLFILFLKSRSKTFFFFLIWFLAGLSLHLQIFPLDLTVSDRWFYLPIVGLLGMMVLIFNKTKVYIILSAFLIIRSFIRIGDWHDGYTLYSHDISYSSDAFDLQNNLGVELFRRGEFAQAQYHFQKSTQLSPQWWTNWNNLGAVIELNGDLRTAQNYYQIAIDNGHYYLAYENMAKILIKTQGATAAAQFSRDSLKYFPSNPTLLEISKY